MPAILTQHLDFTDKDLPNYNEHVRKPKAIPGASRADRCARRSERRTINNREDEVEIVNPIRPRNDDTQADESRASEHEAISTTNDNDRFVTNDNIVDEIINEDCQQLERVESTVVEQINRPLIPPVFCYKDAHINTYVFKESILFVRYDEPPPKRRACNRNAWDKRVNYWWPHIITEVEIYAKDLKAGSGRQKPRTKLGLLPLARDTGLPTGNTIYLQGNFAKEIRLLHAYPKSEYMDSHVLAEDFEIVTNKLAEILSQIGSKQRLFAPEYQRTLVHRTP